MSHTTTDVPRPPGFRRGVRALALALLTSGVGCVLIAPAPAAAARVPTTQPLAVLMQDQVARTQPKAGARRIELVESLRPLTRVRTVLPVLRRATSSAGNLWLRVRLPGRPSGHTGWIPARHTRRAFTQWRIAIRLSTRRVTIYRDGRAVRRFEAVVGKPSTPTPQGRFFIEEALALSNQVGGPFALATSARSDVLQEFEGGPGQIAMHGTNGLPGTLGSAVSHGCIRLSTGDITWLSSRIGSGVPLTIRQ